MNVTFNMSVIDMIHDMALSNQIWSLLLWGDLHPAPNIFFNVGCPGPLLRDANLASPIKASCACPAQAALSSPLGGRPRFRFGGAGVDEASFAVFRGRFGPRGTIQYWNRRISGVEGSQT